MSTQPSSQQLKINAKDTQQIRIQQQLSEIAQQNSVIRSIIQLEPLNRQPTYINQNNRRSHQQQRSYITYQEFNQINSINRAIISNNKNLQVEKCSNFNAVNTQRMFWNNPNQGLGNTEQVQGEKNGDCLVLQSGESHLIITQSYYPSLYNVQLSIDFEPSRKKYLKISSKIGYVQPIKSDTKQKSGPSNALAKMSNGQNSVKYEIEVLGLMTRLSISILNDQVYKVWKQIELPTRSSNNADTHTLKIVEQRDGKIEICYNCFGLVFELVRRQDKQPRNFVIQGDLSIRKIQFQNIVPVVDTGREGCDSKCLIF